MASAKPDEVRDGVPLTNLDQPLFEGSDATKRDLIDYLDGIADRLVPVLADRPLSVMRAHAHEAPFMQKNLPRYAPEWIARVTYWAETSKRNVAYALCNDKRTLLWFGNQRAVEYHPALVRGSEEGITHIVLDLDPTEAGGFRDAVRAAHLVRATLDDLGLVAAVKTSGAKGMHIFVPVIPSTTVDDAASATRAIAERAAALDPSIATTAFVKDERGGKVFIDATRGGGGATVVAAYSPRLRAGAPVSWPCTWDDLDQINPADFTIRNALERLDGADPWANNHPAPQALPQDLVDEGSAISGGRVQAMHEGLRRARARRKDEQ